METQAQLNTPAEHRNGAVFSMQSGATQAVAGTEKVVRRYPLASLDIALGAGIAIGAAAHHLLMPKRQRSVLERLRKLF